MKKIVLALVLLLGSVQMTKAFILPEISDSSEFYMIACEPGKEAYQLFGHAAIRVVDPTTGFDVAFNWGVFSFEAPNFIGRFVLGQTDYELAVWPTHIFLDEYEERGSAVHQCHINLTNEEKHRLWKKLCINYAPENKVYRYNFIFDNCATRVVDMILTSYDSIDAPSFDLPSMSYRDFVNVYTHTDNWLALGINLVFGKQADKVVTARESATFPLQAMQLLINASVKRDSVEEPILSDHVFLCNPSKMGAWRDYSKGKLFMMCALPLAILAFMIFMFFWHRNFHFERISTEILLWVLFILSQLLVFLKYFTIHPLVDMNLNILWCTPLTGLLAIFILIKGRCLIFKTYLSFIILGLTTAFLILLSRDAQEVTTPLFCWWLLTFGCELLVFMSYLPKYIKHVQHKVKGTHHHHHHHHHHHSEGDNDSEHIHSGEHHHHHHHHNED